MSFLGNRSMADRVSPAAWDASLLQVEARLARVPTEHRERCGRVMRGDDSQQGFSQAWQDWILYRNFFANQTDGVYVDIGANEAVSLSNTAFFDICLGWRGACFEPQERYHARIRSLRSCTLVPHCVLGRAANVTMTGKGVDRGIKIASGDGKGNERCVAILDALASVSLPTTIDLLSIDIEGAEPHVLRCMPWHKLQVRFVLIETNRHDMRLVDGFFSAHGFANVMTMWGHTSTSHRAFPLDNLYMRHSLGPLVTPRGRARCNAEDRKLNPWCGGHHLWLEDPTWGRCTEG